MARRGAGEATSEVRANEGRVLSLDIAEVIGAVVGIAILVVVGIPVIGFAVTAAATVVALQVAIGGYRMGIPYNIAFRIMRGRWPQQ